ncbi:MAG: hypothetical protein AB2551_03065 [Candidatus Thiodiazotropha sp.]
MDRSFVEGIKSKGDNSIINAIISMARGLNLAGCHLAQGFFYSRPVPED